MSPSVVLKSPPPLTSRTSANQAQASTQPPNSNSPSPGGCLRHKLLSHQYLTFLHTREIPIPWPIHPGRHTRLHIANGEEGLASQMLHPEHRHTGMYRRSSAGEACRSRRFIHGQSCIDCHAAYPADKMKDLLARSVLCETCAGLVKPNIVFFGESLPREFHMGLRMVKKADLVIVMGSSPSIHPFAALPGWQERGLSGF
ncbi:DHS-like NAD/FAD-binding domain-containing protein [Tuber brumale]|nr:DHS-like NAD/FAD-binding domain-containing protein [Tuber brumale]